MNRTIDMILILVVVFFMNSYFVAERPVQTELYFGLSQANGTIISDSAWNDFVKEDVSKVFSTGFTVIHSDGNWVDEKQNQLHTEPSRIVMAVNTMSSAVSARIDSLREKYKSRFKQESVLRIDKKAAINF